MGPADVYFGTFRALSWTRLLAGPLRTRDLFFLLVVLPFSSSSGLCYFLTLSKWVTLLSSPPPFRWCSPFLWCCFFPSLFGVVFFFAFFRSGAAFLLSLWVVLPVHLTKLEMKYRNMYLNYTGMVRHLVLMGSAASPCSFGWCCTISYYIDTCI